MKIPILLLSGLLSNQRLWEHQKRQLAEIASIHIHSAAENTPQKMVEAILKNAPLKFALAGHSMGAWLCLEIMRTEPSRVTRLCLLNGTARSDSEEKKDLRKKMIERVEKGEFRQVVKELVDRFVYQVSAKGDVEKMFLEVGETAFIHQQQAMLARKECESILPHIRCPTLIIHAAQDRNFSLEEHQELAGRIPKAKLVTIENSGHMSPIEKPDAVTAQLRFWLGNPPEIAQYLSAK